MRALLALTQTVAVLCAFCLASVPAQAQHCYSYRPVVTNYQSSYYQPTYYQPTYTPYYAELVIQPRAVQVVTSPDYYFSVNNYARDNLLADAIAFRILTAQGQFANPTQTPAPSRRPNRSPFR
jgi:hypothetical protein